MGLAPLPNDSQEPLLNSTAGKMVAGGQREWLQLHLEMDRICAAMTPESSGASFKTRGGSRWNPSGAPTWTFKHACGDHGDAPLKRITGTKTTTKAGPHKTRSLKPWSGLELFPRLQ